MSLSSYFFIFSLTTPYGKLILLNIIEPSQHEYDLYTTKATNLKDHEGNIVGSLPLGTILYEPCRHDLDFTDPGDPSIWKIYIEPAGSDLVKLKNDSSSGTSVLLLDG